MKAVRAEDLYLYVNRYNEMVILNTTTNDVVLKMSLKEVRKLSEKLLVKVTESEHLRQNALEAALDRRRAAR